MLRNAYDGNRIPEQRQKEICSLGTTDLVAVQQKGLDRAILLLYVSTFTIVYIRKFRKMYESIV